MSVIFTNFFRDVPIYKRNIGLFNLDKFLLFFTQRRLSVFGKYKRARSIGAKTVWKLCTRKKYMLVNK